MSKPLVFLTMPRYSAQVDARAHRAFLAATRGEVRVDFGTEGIGGSPVESQTSVLTQAFNQPWVMALNLRRTHPVAGFAMLHADVEPEYGWLDPLWTERCRLGADILSVVIPFKLPNGRTSTALGNPDWPADAVDPAEKPRRLTMHEVSRLPKSFRARDIDPSKFLMVNTGCWVCDFSKPWVEQIVFRFHNRNYQDGAGLWHTACRTEDFDLSLQAHRLGLSVWATTCVRAIHHGDCAYPNFETWGDETDQEYAAHVKANSANVAVKPG